MKILKPGKGYVFINKKQTESGIWSHIITMHIHLRCHPRNNLVTSYLDVNVKVLCGSNKIQSRGLISNGNFVHVTINRQDHFSDKVQTDSEEKDIAGYIWV